MRGFHRSLEFHGSTENLADIIAESMAVALAEEGQDVDEHAVGEAVHIEMPEGSDMVSEIVVKVAVTLLSKYGAALIDKVWQDHVWPRLKAHFGDDIEERDEEKPADEKANKAG